MDKAPQFNRDNNITKKIMPLNDPSYSEKQEERQEDPSFNKRFFEDELINIDNKISNFSLYGTSFNKIIKSLEEKRSGEIKKIKEYLFKKIFVPHVSVETLLTQYIYLKALNLPGNLHEKFDEMIKNNPSESTQHSNNESVKSIFGDDFIYQCVTYITKNPEKLDDQLLVEIIYERKKLFDRIDQSLQENKDKFQKDFLNGLENLKLKFKLNFDINTIEKKLLQTKLGCTDPLVSELEGIGGKYNPDTHKILISTARNKNEINHIYNHEALHATSGITVLKETLTSSSKKDDFSSDYYSLLRSGFRFQSPSRKKVSLNWINEAITEDMAIEMSETDTSEIHSYEDERSILYFLLENSNNQISKTDFYNAYFEDYDYENEQKNPNWKFLFNKIQSIYGNTFLQRLDKLIKKNGIKKAEEMIKSGDFKSI